MKNLIILQEDASGDILLVNKSTGHTNPGYLTFHALRIGSAGPTGLEWVNFADAICKCTVISDVDHLPHHIRAILLTCAIAINEDRSVWE